MEKPFFIYNGKARDFETHMQAILTNETTSMSAEKMHTLTIGRKPARPRLAPPSLNAQTVARTQTLVRSLRASRAIAEVMGQSDCEMSYAAMQGALASHLAQLVSEYLGEAAATLVTEAIGTPATETELGHARLALKLAPVAGTAHTP